MSTLIRKHADKICKGMPLKMLTNLIKPAVMVLDEIGYTLLYKKAATLLMLSISAAERENLSF